MSKVYFIGAGPGDIELLTIKGQNALKKSEIVIYAGSLVNKDILVYAENMVESYDSSGMNLGEIMDIIKNANSRGFNVARLHTGDPSLYGAILEQSLELDKLGIEYEIIPGVTALFAASASLGVELTAPNIAQSVVITRIEGRTPMPKNESLDKIISHGGTFCFYLSILKIKDIVETFLKKGFNKDTPAAVCYRVSWPDEVIIKGTLMNIEEKVRRYNITRQALVIVGDVLDRNIEQYSKLYDKGFSHGFRK
jgi:precorrin-4/cobalt-precorrin-4 C11-methyltransferase